MSHFVAGILRIVLLEASAALLVIDRTLDAAIGRPAERLSKNRTIAAWVVAVLSVFVEPVGLLALLALLWLASARRRRAQRKYEGLRVLR